MVVTYCHPHGLCAIYPQPVGAIHRIAVLLFYASAGTCLLQKRKAIKRR